MPSPLLLLTAISSPEAAQVGPNAEEAVRRHLYYSSNWIQFSQ